MYPLRQISIDSIMRLTNGSPKLIVGIIDGPVDLEHNAFRQISTMVVNKKYEILCHKSGATSAACVHGTFIAGVLAADRKSDAPSICPSCKFAIRPIFRDNVPPTSDTKELSEAIFETVNAGAKVVNLSLGMEQPVGPIRHLEEACIHARDHDSIIVLSAGNQGRMGGISLLNNEWVIPVAACDHNGRPLVSSNLGTAIGEFGILAPGLGIKSTIPNNKYSYMVGTSVAAAFVTGAIALLWSLLPNARSSEIIYSIRKGSTTIGRSVVPSLLNAQAALTVLKKIHQ